MLAEDSLPIVEMKADRTMVYPQRMALLDVLQMMPELMIAGYEELISDYNLRIDNVPVNGDVRLVLSQMKAKDIAKIQVCTNTGVAKGTIGMGHVLDINMAMPDTVKGFVEGQGGFGKKQEGNGTVNVLYGSARTDLYANASYRYQNGHKEYVTLHRARYFHTFNEAGTELLVLGGYQYASDQVHTNQLPMFVLELNTPLAKGLDLMAGVEGDYLMTKEKGTDNRWSVFNHDIYLQLTYALPQWRFTAGHRVMLYNYRLSDAAGVQKRFDVRNNTDVCVIYVPNSRHQIQVGYYRKYYNPAYPVEPALADTLLWERDINQFKVAYAYSTQQLTIQPEGSFYIVEGAENFGEIGASAYWKTKWVTLTGGANVHMAKSTVFASVRCAPTAYLPRQWQIGLQVVYFTKQSPIRALYGTPVYGCLSVNKQIGSFLNIGVEWHDMFDSFCKEAKVNRHAATIKVQYRF